VFDCVGRGEYFKKQHLMCGIACIWNNRLDDRKRSKQSVSSMLFNVDHRGYDQVANNSYKSFDIGVRRLAITGSEDQPAVSGDWTVWMNGEVYNYLEIAEFPTKSDTQAVADALNRDGLDAVKTFNGMFVIFAWNGKNLFVIRDRYGIKPMYWWENGDEIVYCSELKGFLAHPDFKAELNQSAVDQYLVFMNVLTNETLLKGVYKIHKGTITAANDPACYKEYWEWEFDQSFNGKFEDAVDEVEFLLRRAVQRQGTTDNPLGVWLSGGLDSNAIVEYSKQLGLDFRTFTAGFDEGKDERKLAELTGVKHITRLFKKEDMKITPEFIWALDDLRVGMSWSNYELYKITAAMGIKVCLQGTGGDELFAGYKWRYNKFFDYWKIVNRTGIINDRGVEVFQMIFPKDNIEARWKFDADHFLEGVLLVGDKLSMSQTIEDRVPFLDNDLVDFCVHLPVEFKNNKKVLRAALERSTIHYDIIRFPKWGFTSPDKIWNDTDNQNLFWANQSLELWKEKFFTTQDSQDRTGSKSKATTSTIQQ